MFNVRTSQLDAYKINKNVELIYICSEPSLRQRLFLPLGTQYTNQILLHITYNETNVYGISLTVFYVF